ncbi:hypothetical protein IEQ34_007822 [Dendrobium chrysotoxum]|uniref:Uncharacterized protein n=1 Tax=Dendrobium chrysotoxum TaxID=161865 RepID=A0AAV7H4W4_DENCH|nr:hypothetical protein IEQ34_007822 [Dendrobium chrysotoxum]
MLLVCCKSAEQEYAGSKLLIVTKSGHIPSQIISLNCSTASCISLFRAKPDIIAFHVAVLLELPINILKLTSMSPHFEYISIRAVSTKASDSSPILMHKP